jgi:hypothetical protein
MNLDDELATLRRPTAQSLRPDRRRAIGLRAGDLFDEAHRSHVRAEHVARVLVTVTLTGAAALYLLWALHVARTFG